MPTLLVPKPLEEALAKLDASGAPLDEYLVRGTITEVGNTLTGLSEAELRGRASEALAFTFVGQNGQTSVWGTHYGPMMEGEGKDGRTIRIPDIANVDAGVITHWMTRATACVHPVLKARYADLAWDMARAAGVRPDPQIARLAIDAYLASTAPQFRTETHGRLSAAVRAFDLALQLKDTKRSDAARAVLLDLHGEAVAENAGFWWMAPTRLLRDNRVGMSDVERDMLVKSLEAQARRFGDAGDKKTFDPNALEQLAGLLKKHYRRHGMNADVKRLDEAVARAFETAAAIAADPMVAPSFLQSAVNAFHAAGLKEEAARARIAMQEAIGESNKALKSIGTEIKIRREDIDTFVKEIVVDDRGQTLVNISKEFLVSKVGLEKQLEEGVKAAPLQAMIPLKIMQDDHVTATIGGIKDDPVGRLIHQAELHFGFSALWLMEALDGALEKHGFTADHLAGWANRHGLFGDTTFLKEGFVGWLENDNAKTLHMLVPQAEAGLRAIAASLDVPVTKAHPATKDASVAINLGDILSNEKVIGALGPDTALHFRSLYADPRGLNLRNRVAHGMFAAHSLDPHVVRLVVHSLLVLGVWKELAAAAKEKIGDITGA